MDTIAPAPQARRRPPRPVLELVSRTDIRFRHPGYALHSLFLSLPRVDSAASIPTHGVHHRTALLACQIIAGNAFTNSYLSLDRAGQQRVQVPLDGVLTENEYYFFVEGVALYPIVPSFQDWEFPHDRIPDWWHPAVPSPAVNCSITNAGYAVEEAHLVPREERLWYRENEMEAYGVGMPDIDNKANILPLRKDIYWAFDARWFVIVPRMVTTDSSVPAAPQYVTHIISRAAAELWPAYHLTIAESIQDECRAYLFARFAWAILFRVKLFVTAGETRNVIRIVRISGTRSYKTERCSGAELESAYGGGGSKTAAPLKQNPRKRRSAQASDQGDLSDTSGDSDAAEDWEEEWGRDRRDRRQASSDETAPDAMPAQPLSEAKVHREPALEAELRAAL
ncbi:hypothetical protein B0T25DRAFT_56175 [Lasiosphaeria hispida]|uniref:HNH nuclease domain-containing protein n=1 Tax=Lasiosphaeria hispida TaxID=260671 RepID=A0AAJ0HW82_9PEZI|nr:hypothetical protein B0T25DRAFT_56175 [Lasiosphaeria hispida]